MQNHVLHPDAGFRPRRPDPVRRPGPDPDAGARRRRLEPLGSPLRFARPAVVASKSAAAGFGAPDHGGGFWMRALGPGSVSSFLKIILDVVYAILWISVGLVALALLAALLFSFN